MNIFLRFCFSICAVAFLGTFSGLSQDGGNKRDEAKQMTFKASLNKIEFLPLEPIAVQFNFSNDTETPIVADPPNFLAVQIESTNEGGQMKREPISFINVKRVSLPQKFEPGESVKEETLVITNLEQLFPVINAAVPSST
jgi:hypothetical protein